MGLFSCFAATRRGRPGKEGTSFDDIGKFGDEKPEVPESTGVSEGEGSLNHQKEQTRSGGIADRQEMFISKQPSSSQPSAHGSRLTEYSIKDHSDPQPSTLLHPHVNPSSTPLNPNRGGSQPQIHIPSPLPPQDSFNSPIAGSRRSDLEMPMSPTSSINPSSPLRRISVAKDDGTYSNPATTNTTRIPAPVRSGLQGSPSGLQGTPSGLQGTPSGLQGTPSGLQGTPSGLRGTPSGLQGTPSGLRGTPSGLQGTPSFKHQAEPLMSPTPSMKAIWATNAATSPAAVPLNTGRDGMTSLTPSSSSPLSPVDGAGIITPAAISEDSPPGLVSNLNTMQQVMAMHAVR
ncbi:hypothetical protein CEUSTIGMA_g6071.t1 [Chlamydomonas eustigma]|uniref:Uncharacterized protein n=1 Tax=Chlamydomonas eustigma TaxID=1157962 RepID=A0A250X6C5_9CHLO|nr:hypothetical protein CEUSTIGMA_g6071.t1 [Chlamydomonas eustigma]|eukprot:GAX78633.1 hypothetical protein CEUSTIGMA_g6071.t1 [Chlamydomonas eustigma]